MEATLDKVGPLAMPATATSRDRTHSASPPTAKGRVCVFIDNSNLFQAIRTLYPPGSKHQRHRRLDYSKLKEVLAGPDADVRFYYASVPQPDSVSDVEGYRAWSKCNKFIEGIKRLGYVVVGLPLRERLVVTESGCQTTYKECGLDCEIIYDMAILSQEKKHTHFILVASDDAYARAIARIRKDSTVEVTVAFFGQVGCSASLIREASRCIDLGLDLDSIFRSYKSS